MSSAGRPASTEGKDMIQVDTSAVVRFKAAPRRETPLEAGVSYSIVDRPMDAGELHEGAKHYGTDSQPYAIRVYVVCIEGNFVIDITVTELEGQHLHPRFYRFVGETTNGGVTQAIAGTFDGMICGEFSVTT